jgi:putative Mg2+ transporter-C (MgtC) family protein
MSPELTQTFLLFGKVVLAGLLGYIIGIERERIGKEAGSRTLSILAAGSALFAILSKEGFLGGDPSRIAAGMVTGLGFLAGGIILIRQGRVEGLTTAATMWTMAGIGMAIGAGLYSLGILVSIFILLILIFRLPIEENPPLDKK